jgi:hypothetical protein
MFTPDPEGAVRSEQPTLLTSPSDSTHEQASSSMTAASRMEQLKAEIPADLFQSTGYEAQLYSLPSDGHVMATKLHLSRAGNYELGPVSSKPFVFVLFVGHRLVGWGM